MTTFNVNGVQVSSDKSLAAISGSRIMFTDGSWYDTQTRQTVNNGPGYITVGVEPSKKTQKLIAPQLFTATDVQLLNLDASAQVIVWNRPQIEVTIEGPDAESIIVRQQGSSVIIQGPEDTGSGNTTVIRNGNSVVTIGGRGRVGTVVSGDYVGGNLFVGDKVSGINMSGISIGGVNFGGSEPTTNVIVRVPAQTSVVLQSVAGNVTIGDTLGSVSAHVGMGDTNIGEISALNVNVKGSGDTNVRTLNGPCSVNLMGSGDVRINNGRMTQLAVNVMGSGDVTVGGTVQSASLSLMGSGNIRVAHCERQPMISKMGSGSIRVSNW